MAFRYLAFILLIIVSSCGPNRKKKEHFDSYTMQLVFPGNEGDFIDLKFELSTNRARIINGEEVILIDSILRKGDSIHFEIPVFDSEIHLVAKVDDLSGEWLKYSKSGRDYRLFVRAQKGAEPLVISDAAVMGKWRMLFSPEGEEPYNAIGIFELKQKTVVGTILTETGDYRYLHGFSKEGGFKLTTFDGAHAFLFKAEVNGDSLKGIFRSGPTYSCPFVGIKDENATLANPKSLTYLKEGYSTLEFGFPDLKGDTVWFDSNRDKGKTTIVQILGSWCPNCMDETRFLTELKKKYGDDLEVLGLCFEYSRDFKIASANVRKMAKNLNSNYPFLIAGFANKSEAGKKLPMLNKVISYPTSIVIDKSGEIVDIHTGFSGPGTGKIYQNFTNDFIAMIDSVISQ